MQPSPPLRLSQPVRLGLLAIALPFSFLTFQFFPGMPLVYESWFVFMALALLLVYAPHRCRKWGQVSNFEIYVLLLAILIPIWSAIAAREEFGQPLLYGLLAQRGMILVAAVPLFTRMSLDRNWIRIRDFEIVLVGLAWGTLLLYLGMALLLEPSSYFEAYGLGFVSGPSQGAQFKFDVVFIVFGFYYYGFRGLRRRAWRDYLRAAIFLLFILTIIRGRSLLLALLGVYLFLTIVWTPNKAKLIALVPKIVLSLGFLWMFLIILAPEFTHLIVSKFSDAFTVLFTGEMTDDASANARIQETLVATPYILKNWAFGSGVVSAQWNGGFEIAVGAYFHPPDIGVLGILFLYGIAGVIFYFIQFIFAFLFGRQVVSTSTYSLDLVCAIKGLIFFTGIRSLATAHIIYFPAPVFFGIAVLWAVNDHASAAFSRLASQHCPSSSVKLPAGH